MPSAELRRPWRFAWRRFDSAPGHYLGRDSLDRGVRSSRNAAASDRDEQGLQPGRRSCLAAPRQVMRIGRCRHLDVGVAEATAHQGGVGSARNYQGGRIGRIRAPACCEARPASGPGRRPRTETPSHLGRRLAISRPVRATDVALRRAPEIQLQSPYSVRTPAH